MIQGIDSASAGIGAALERFDRTAASIARTGTGLPGEGDLVTDIVNLEAEKIAVAASVTVARTADELLGSVLDIMA